MVDMINPRVEKIMETTLPQSREFQLRVITSEGVRWKDQCILTGSVHPVCRLKQKVNTNTA